MTISATFEEKTARPIKRTACAHCGDDCPSQPVFFSEKPFCCEGCKTVFDILSANGLGQFYQIDRSAAFSLKGRRREDYAWLDDPEASEKLLDFSDGKTAKITLQLPQIHCASCVWLLENLYKLSPGVLASKVNFLKKEAYLTFAVGQVSLRQMMELLASIGYAPDLNLGSIERPAALPRNRRLIFHLGVAGFAFGNIMLLSFPEYLGMAETEGWFRQLFGYLNLLLATPVAFYSGQDYLKGAWHAVRSRTTSIDIPLALGIVVLYFRSAFEVLTESGAGYFDSLAGLVFFLLIGKWFQQVSYHRIQFDRDYKAYFPMAATRISAAVRPNRSLRPVRSAPAPESVPVQQLEVGDLILVRSGEIIPADGILKRGKGNIDYSFVTGESVPVERHSGDKIYAGGRQAGEAIELSLTKKVSQSYLTQLWNEDAFGEAFQQQKLGGASRLANRVSRYFTLIILAIAFATLAYWLPKDARTAFNAFTAVLIIACPCAAALNVPFTLGNTLRILARRGLYLKNTNVAEALYRFSAAVFDKTGTLTLAAGNDLSYEGEPMTEEEMAWVRALAGQSSHPLSRAIAGASDASDRVTSSHPVTLPEVSGFRETAGQGIEGTVGGQKLRIGSKAFTSYAGTTLADATVFVEINGEVKGGFRLHNRYRPAAWGVLDWFKRRGRVFLLSGDNEREEAYLSGRFPGSLHFHQSPKEKLDFIRSLQSKGEKVLMFGDGLNDAGALRQADVGMVVAEDANNFTPACDAILDARKFAQLPRFLDFIKKSIHTVYAAWVLAGLYNVVGLSYAVQGELSPVVAAILMPASSLTIVAFGVGVTSLMAKWLDGYMADSHVATQPFSHPTI